LLDTGVLKPDDDEGAADPIGEDEILEFIRKRDWEYLRAPKDTVQAPHFAAVKRRWLLRPLGRLREALPRGDR
jgi:hypothetical protein